MSFKTKTKGVLAGLTLLGAGALAPAKAGWDAGIDVNLGFEGLNASSPNNGQPVTVTGYTGTSTGIGGRPTTHTINLPSSKSFTRGMIGVTPFIGYTSDDESFAKDFKLGIDLNAYWNMSGSTRTMEDVYYFASRTLNGWGEWPNVAVIAEIEQRNIFFLEKPFHGFKNKEENGHLSLIARLDQFSIKSRGTTAKVPYGSGWYGSYEGTITSSVDLGEQTATALSTGVRASYEGNLTDWFRIGGFIELSHGLPFGDIYPGLGVRLGASGKF